MSVKSQPEKTLKDLRRERDEVYTLLNEQSKPLREKLSKLEEAVKTLENKEEERRRESIVANIDFILDCFFPEHGRTSCSDDSPVNRGRCSRCALLEVKASSYLPDSFQLSMDLSGYYGG